ncbi:Protein of unknown function [Cotesia congregata]|uniref:Uncharacterized protein n=1 Tax=Cotesia congregata TaxID=51543 RepID=A0A8J2HM82_COTCN|nr:Protein of unknown function [Cotesia congregata]
MRVSKSCILYFIVLLVGSMIVLSSAKQKSQALRNNLHSKIPNKDNNATIEPLTKTPKSHCSKGYRRTWIGKCVKKHRA